MGKHITELLSKSHYTEAIDRTLIISNMIDNYLIQHPVFKLNRELSQKIEIAGSLIYEVNQALTNQNRKI